MSRQRDYDVAVWAVMPREGGGFVARVTGSAATLEADGAPELRDALKGIGARKLAVPLSRDVLELWIQRVPREPAIAGARRANPKE